MRKSIQSGLHWTSFDHVASGVNNQPYSLTLQNKIGMPHAHTVVVRSNLRFAGPIIFAEIPQISKNITFLLTNLSFHSNLKTTFGISQYKIIKIYLLYFVKKYQRQINADLDPKHCFSSRKFADLYAICGLGHRRKFKNWDTKEICGLIITNL